MSINDKAVSLKAAGPAIVQGFEIDGMFGYRTVGLNMPHAASVFIAQNGTGKTTLLAALNAVLHRQFGKLRTLDFNRIRLKLKDQPTIEIDKVDIDNIFESGIDPDLLNTANQIEIGPNKLFKYLTEKFSPEQSAREYYTTRTTLDDIVEKFDYNLERGVKFARESQKKIYGRSNNLALAYEAITSAISSYEIVYLPTYRRIELVLDEDKSQPRYARTKPSIEYGSDSLYSGSMQFGLSDITDRLESLNNSLTSQSDSGYRRISVNIINDLVESDLHSVLKSRDAIPTDKELKVFFSRVGKQAYLGPVEPITVPNIDAIYSRAFESTDEGQFLRYFLTKLGDVIKKTREIEEPIREFVRTCNKYLGGDEESEEVWADRYYSRPPDAKRLVLDRSNLSISVKSTNSKENVPLDALSSGEKQMISLFAKMYLYHGNKIVLIDEPELSLSIGWQTLIIPDIFSANSCHQIVAITHSPFIFENFLENYARSVSIDSLHEPRLYSDLFGGEDE